MWRARRWRFLANLIDHLPRDSFLVEAMADDDEVAASVLAREQPDPRERVSEWSGLREALARVEDAVRTNTAATIAVAGGQSWPVRPVLRPVTAIDRLKWERRMAEHRQRVAEVLGR